MTCCHFAKDEKSWLNNEQKRNKKDTEEVNNNNKFIHFCNID